VADRTLIPYSPSIEVEYIAPPIPLRDFDYRANFASYEPGDCLGCPRCEWRPCECECQYDD
jgi:hypothetical protein